MPGPMKALLLLIVLLSLLAPGWAQQPKTIFDFKQELSLSEEQMNAMKAQLAELRSSVKLAKEELLQLEKEYRALIQDEATTAAQAKVKLEQIASVTTTMRLKDLEISRKITATMSVEQREKWKAIQAREKAKKPS